MWKQRIHKLFHRLCGGAVVAVGLLQELRAVDLTPILREHTSLVVSILGAVIVVLEFLPLVGNWIDGEDKTNQPQQ